MSPIQKGRLWRTMISGDKNRVLLLFSLLAALMPSACVTPGTEKVVLDPKLVEAEAHKQRTVAMQSLFFDEIRLNRVSYPILKAALPYSGKPPRPYLGIYFANKYSFAEMYREAAVEVYGVDEQFTILDVIRNSPADRDGLLPGDILVRLGGDAFPAGRKGPEIIDAFFNRHLSPDRPVHLIVRRDKELADLEITPTGVADYDVILSPKQNVNARATGNRILINRGLLRFAETDNELALVISHEIAHNVMGHVKAVVANYTLGTLLDVAAISIGVITGNSIGASAALSQAQAFEAEADYVGLYIMAKAGLPIDNAPEFWRRMATIYPGTIKKRILSTHPASPERSVAMMVTIKEIHEKEKAGLPLQPDLRRKTH